MRALKPLIYLFLLTSLIVGTATHLLLPEVKLSPGILLGTITFIIISMIFLIIVFRSDRARLNEMSFEQKLLFVFRQLLRRKQIFSSNRYLKLKYIQNSKLQDVYLEDFDQLVIEQIRYFLPENYRLTKYGRIERFDHTELDLDDLIGNFEENGWQVYYVRKPTADQYFTIQHLRRLGG